MILKKLNKKILTPIILLSIISIITIISANTYISKSLGNLAIKQITWYTIGFLLMFIILKLKNNFFYENYKLLYTIGILSLIGLLFFAPEINNSKCWYIIPGIGSVQPSEFMKIFLMITLAISISNFRNKISNPTIKDEILFIIKTLIIILIPSIFTFLQPDTGAVLIYFIIYIFMMFSSGIRIRWFIIGTLILLFILALILILYFYYENIFIEIFSTNIYYRLQRLFDWKNGTGLQLENAITTIGSAGLFGHGFNKTPLYFPESGTDFIFAVFASNFGLITTLGLISIIIYLDINILSISKKKIPYKDKYILSGIIGMLLFQQIQNISMTIGLLPITGITLPFISYGGSSLLSYMIIIGIVLNISNQKENLYYN